MPVARKRHEHALPEFLCSKSEGDKLHLEISVVMATGTQRAVFSALDPQPTCLGATMWHLDTFLNRVLRRDAGHQSRGLQLTDGGVPGCPCHRPGDAVLPPPLICPSVRVKFKLNFTHLFTLCVCVCAMVCMWRSSEKL